MTKLPVRLATVLAWLAGAALLVWVFAQVDRDAVLAAMRAIGLWGVALAIAYHAVPLVCDAAAWRLLFPVPRPSLPMLTWARWIGEAGNALLPAQAGEVIRIRAAILRGASSTASAASGIVDLSIGVVAQIVFSLLGLALFAQATGFAEIVLWLASGIAALLLGVVGFIAVQHRGLFGALAPLVSRWAARAPILAGAVDQAIGALWRRPRILLPSAAWRFAGCLAGAGEVWLVFWLLGAEIGLAEAVALESLGQAARAAAFLIPSGLGVQEGALLLLAAALGIPAESALALALVKRVRELALGVPALLSWQAAELRARRFSASA